MAFSELAVLKSDSFQMPVHKDEYSLKIHFSMDCRGYTDLQEAGDSYMQVYIVSGSNCIM